MSGFKPKRQHVYRLQWRRAPKARRLRIFKGINREVVAADIKTHSPWRLILSYRVTIKGPGRPMLSLRRNRKWRPKRRGRA